ncbi:ABC transporter ATP-binding protein [Cellulomonas soli]
MHAPVIQAEHLHKRYGSTVAVDDVSLEVHPGEIFGILGRNGAGKTTTVEMIGGLRTQDSGTVRVLGLDPHHDAAQLRQRVGLQLQESAMPARLRPREALELYASFYDNPAEPAELLDALGLADRAEAPFDKLSGGQKQRLSVALALVGNPTVAILDELTTGLDPHARRETWGVIERIRERGVTIVLVTHLMEEAERLCDRLALIDAGRVLVTGTPDEVVARASGSEVLVLRPSRPLTPDELAALSALPTVSQVGSDDASAEGRLEVHGTGTVVQDTLVALDRVGVQALDVRLERASLEDAFVALTGRGAEHDETPDPQPAEEVR